MKTAVVYYSYTGKTRELAAKMAEAEQAELLEVRETKRRSTFSAYVFGSLAARRQKKAKIQPVGFSLSGYDRILVAVPLWAGFPAPAFQNILELIPQGKEIELTITSGSGNSSGSKEKTLALAAGRGVKIVKYQDVKTSG